MRQRRSLAALAVAVIIVGQLVALVHEAAVRHVTCLAHGEQIEAPALAGAIDHCQRVHFTEVQGGGGEHEDCAIARVLRQSSDPVRCAPVLDVTTVIARVALPPRRTIVPSLDLVLIAPKTSPPA